jgi:hypothetical protein
MVQFEDFDDHNEVFMVAVSPSFGSKDIYEKMYSRIKKVCESFYPKAWELPTDFSEAEFKYEIQQYN